jgi:putative transposase
MDKFQNKYRISSCRLQNWDYSWNAAYFVTICTFNKQCYFGNIQQNDMKFSEIGEKANEYWLAIPKHFPFVKLDVHVVMPNHVHGIVIIDKPNDPSSSPSSPKNKFGPQSQNLASIIRGYKTGVTMYARIHNIDFAWQSRYYDHIIRDSASYQRIKKYIINNPKKWNNDKLFKNDS